MKPPTAKQTAMLRAIADAIQRTGFPPTIRELGEALSLRSSSTVSQHLCALAANGLITRDFAKPRALRLTPAGEAVLGATSVPASNGFTTEYAARVICAFVPVINEAADRGLIEPEEVTSYHDAAARARAFLLKFAERVGTHGGV
jgi:SOS-response transcriptional repressor LexA